jgi:hypothetical protein
MPYHVRLRVPVQQQQWRPITTVAYVDGCLSRGDSLDRETLEHTHEIPATNASHPGAEQINLSVPHRVLVSGYHARAFFRDRPATLTGGGAARLAASTAFWVVIPLAVGIVSARPAGR